MRFLFASILVLAVSVVTGLILKEDNGYILIGFDHWSVEGSLAFFLLLNLLLFGLCYLLIRLLARLLALPDAVQIWLGRREKQRAANALNQGLVELSEGNWKRAEKRLIRHAGRSDTPLLNYLSAARSAQQQGELERRDKYLQMAHDVMPAADLAVGLTQAELQLEHGQYEPARSTLSHLRSVAPHHAAVLRLLTRLYQHRGEWRHLQQLLPDLRKSGVMNKDELQQMELSIFSSLLDAANATDQTERLTDAWNQMPAAFRRMEPLIERYTGYLRAHDEDAVAESVLRKAIGEQWSDRLVEIYGQLKALDPKVQLTTAESWLEQHRTNPFLLLTLGRLSLHNSLWGKARSYLEASIGAGPLAATYQELGALLEKMDEPEHALDSYREGLKLASGSSAMELPDTVVKQPLTNRSQTEQPQPDNVVRQLA